MGASTLLPPSPSQGAQNVLVSAGVNFELFVRSLDIGDSEPTLNSSQIVEMGQGWFCAL